MPYFVKRKKGVNPTRFWVADTRFPLEVDFADHSLSGVRVGGMVERLQRLGPAEDPDAGSQGTYCYFSRGLEIEEENGLVTSYRFVWSGDEDFDGFTGICKSGDSLLPLGEQTTEAEFVERFGQPYWRDASDDETLLFYEHGDIEWQIGFSAAGRLNEIIFCKPAMLADPANRESYGVTRPWPPNN